MKNTELRIGNIFLEKFSQTEIRVLELLSNERIIFEGDFKNDWQAEPIPISEEWLIKLGFEKTLDNEFTLRYDLKNDARFDYFLPRHKLKTFGLRFQGIAFFDTIKNVHQLQNFYFGITGKELSYENIS